MPKIPRYLAPVIKQPRMSPEAMSRPYRALAQAGEDIAAMGSRSLRILGAIEAREREAERILLEAKEQAEKMKKEAQEKAEEVYRETYQEIIAQAKRKSVEIKEKARMDAERDAQVFLKRAEKQKKEILKETEEKFGEAVMKYDSDDRLKGNLTSVFEQDAKYKKTIREQEKFVKKNSGLEAAKKHIELFKQLKKS